MFDMFYREFLFTAVFPDSLYRESILAAVIPDRFNRESIWFSFQMDPRLPLAGMTG
ncbi:MAG: hypothetical protein H0X47_08905 [Nitrospirales bacterium]|nr:hypothetical protein [Nitrospirales bacterium]